MEAVGLAIGIPGLLTLLLKTSLSGYEAIMSIQDANIEIADYLRRIEIEYQCLRDWHESTKHITSKINLENDPPEHRARFRNIVLTLASVAKLFAESEEMTKTYRAKDTDKMPYKSAKRFLHVSYWQHRRNKSETNLVSVKISKELGDRKSTSPPWVLSSMSDGMHEDDKLKRLITLAKTRGSKDLPVSTFSSLKWVMYDKNRIEDLYKNLKSYNEDLKKCTKPLLSLKKPSTGLEPNSCIFIVPFPRNPNFTEREDVFHRLDEYLLHKDGAQSRAVLWGLGGIGKTTIAVEYCYQKAQSLITVLWVHGNSNDTFKASYQKIAERAKLQNSESDKEDSLEVVKEWLDSSHSGDWIMIIDNVDDISLETKHIPTRRGAILFTTRDKRILLEERYAVNSEVELQQMSLSEGNKMARKLRLGNGLDFETDADAINELLRIMGSLPLAIAQSVAYIKRTGISVLKYLELFNASATTQQMLLNKPLSTNTRDSSTTERTVMMTWGVTMEQIRKEDSLAIDILQFMSLMDTERISLELVSKAPHFKDKDEISIQESIAMLLSFALISQLRDSSEPHYRLHRLVSFWTRSAILEPQNTRILENALVAIHGVIPEDSVANDSSYSKSSQLVPHAVAALRYSDQVHLESENVWTLQCALAHVFAQQGEYGKALEWYQRALEGEEKVLGPNHTSTLRTVCGIATVFSQQGEFGKALEWYQRALEGQEKVLGPNNSYTLATVYGIATVFSRQGEVGKALEWYQRALEGQEKVLGPNNSYTLTTVYGIATVFFRQGEYGKALEWYQRALEGQEKVLGPNNSYTLATVRAIAGVFSCQGEYGKALEWYQRALEGYEKTVGPNHTSTLGIVYDIATIFSRQGEYGKALEWYQRALEGYEKPVGPNHTSTLATVRAIAGVFEAEGKYDEAIRYSIRFCNGLKTVPGGINSRVFHEAAETIERLQGLTGQS
ncbi:hypothetical protein EDC01DRAFT_633552 [Geopyxis carbonaria]|nr:hypothetical protein EDC01DRAFT_633552 [Geopyxis carbonaria]